MGRLYRFVARHALVSIVVVVWALALTTWVTTRVFGAAPPDVPAGTAAAFATAFALPALAVGLWKWRKGR